MLYDSLITTNKAAFLNMVAQISATLGIDPDWLMAVMYIESAGSFRPDIRNAATGATGLIQFMPSTAIGLHTTTTALALMSNVEQLDYVYAYFKPYTGKLKSVTDLYAVTFFPRALGKPDSYILQTDTLKASTIARQNPIFDTNKDGQITYGEFKAAVMAKIPSGAVAYLKKK